MALEAAGTVGTGAEAEALFSAYARAIADEALPPQRARDVWSGLLEVLEAKRGCDDEAGVVVGSVIEATGKIVGLFEAVATALDTLAAALGITPEAAESRQTAALAGLQAALQVALPHTLFEEVMAVVYKEALLVFGLSVVCRDDDDEEYDDEDDDAENDDEDEAATSAGSAVLGLDSLTQLMHQLSVLGLAQASVSVVTQLLYRVVEAHILSQAKGEFEEAWLDELIRWMEADVAVAVEAVVKGCGNATVAHLRERLWFHMYEAFGELRIRELFDIIVDFPDSAPAVEDLRRALARTWQHERLVDVLSAAFDKRLLHLGANTVDILGQYVSSIKVLTRLDPSGVMLDSVSHGIRNYLKNREDTIRCVVTSLTDPSPTSLLGGELVSASGPTGSGVGGGRGGGAANEDYDNWTPAPLESGALSATTTAPAARTDILAMLVNIYGSQELFVSEYKVLLASKLLAITDYNTDDQVRNSELLKLRFGESSMQPAEVMLKDLADSKRINAYVHSHEGGGDNELVVSGTVISRLFWPPLKEVNFQLPPAMAAQMETYAKAFHSLKTPRTLSFLPNLGSVSLTLEFDDTELEVTVSPLLATIISYFDAKTAAAVGGASIAVDGTVTWPARALAKVVGIDVALLRKQMVYWLAASVVVDAGDECYASVSVLGDAPSSSAGGAGGMDADSGVASLEDQKAEEMRVYQSYVNGMLGNLGALPAERIHNMLKMFVANSGYTASLNELISFLNTLVRKEELAFADGMYSLPK
ncbi:anaphase-promoting complex subunit 2 [Thecamonas trahens ATCC 50062]|uniref:Anaphase-promoting complex subunit 2 n=1 Tax=Thecamonas trahens ATCC 50062 TaxID=461836 RepID=A0A0L0DSY7_THETB|nr:anaphase-promoting complex subunit 2 [Thecamonas trahens ATCC 50062]KNC55342.1 anaphase-promoting complex subunit 2 [Thecamonas trahens ATCC 50062]|eukprot:XP_013753063.1 anaphase-promoting complex subunit 2 [Thecamonas trahens ATCC 50062]